MFKPIFAFLVSIFLFAACDSADTSATMLRYQVSLEVGNPTVATGELRFTEPSMNSTTTGVFTLSDGAGEPVEPLSVTSGTLSAFLSPDGEIQIDISDPNVSDSGLSFVAEFSESGFSGEWGRITFIGYTEAGTFGAVRVE